MKHVSLQKIARMIGVDVELNFQVTGYQIDSRMIGPGNLFFALKGERVDGHSYLEEVSGKGAVGAVVSRDYQGPDFGLVLLRVENVVETLQKLARDFMLDCEAELIGVTGSLGKTMTKEFIATLLEGKFKVGKTHLNYNTKLTYPITLLNRTGEEDVLVVELGMSQPGDLKRLLEIAAPDLAVLTKVAWVHGAFFSEGITGIAKEKATIFSHPKTKMAIFDHAFYNYPEVVQRIGSERISFSLEDRSADYFFSSEYFIDERGVRAYQFDPVYKQPHLLHNFLAAVAVARAMKMGWDEINRQVPKLQLPKMRFEQMEKGGVIYINDAYNANPDSMKAALSHLPEPKEGGKRIAVLGMMADMGPDSEQIHREVGRFAQRYIDHLLVMGPEATGFLEGFEEGKKPAEQCFDFPRLFEKLKELARPGDVVLVKASRRVQMETLFNLINQCSS